MTYEQLLAAYQKTHPGAVNGDAFNQWTTTLPGGDKGWENITSTTAGGGSLTPGTQPPATDVTSTIPTIPGGNYSQVQNANQGGQFSTSGSNENLSTQNTGSTTNVGGSTTSTPTDTLGFGDLLKGSAGSATASDAARNGFLTDLMQNGGTAFQSQLDQGIRNSLSGPQMTGAGDSARARASGYAAAQVGRNNVDQRLNAAQQLSGPTALSSLSTAANPYIGQSNKTEGSTNVSGFTDLLQKGTEAQSGTTAAQSSQAGAGLIPQGQPVKTGGCVLCTAGIELKLPGSRLHRVLRKVIKHKLHVDPSRFASASRGYFLLFTPFARYLLNHRWFASLLWPLARAVVYEELRVSGKRLPFRAVAWGVHWFGHVICSVVGFMVRKAHVTDPVILDIARRENVLFEIKEVV